MKKALLQQNQISLNLAKQKGTMGHGIQCADSFRQWTSVQADPSGWFTFGSLGPLLFDQKLFM